MDTFTIPGIYPAIRVGDTFSIQGSPNRLPLWRHGIGRRIWAWLRGRDLEDVKLKTFVVTHAATSQRPAWLDELE